MPPSSCLVLVRPLYGNLGDFVDPTLSVSFTDSTVITLADAISRWVVLFDVNVVMSDHSS